MSVAPRGCRGGGGAARRAACTLIALASAAPRGFGVVAKARPVMPSAMIIAKARSAILHVIVKLTYYFEAKPRENDDRRPLQRQGDTVSYEGMPARPGHVLFIHVVKKGAQAGAVLGTAFGLGANLCGYIVPVGACAARGAIWGAPIGAAMVMGKARSLDADGITDRGYRIACNQGTPGGPPRALRARSDRRAPTRPCGRPRVARPSRPTQAKTRWTRSPLEA
jgi:hypothetical protein